MYNTDAHEHTDTDTSGITIRVASPLDAADLLRLAERDSRELPAGSMLVAVAGGRIRAAAPVSGAEPISDPFVRSSEMVALLEARVDQLRRRGGRGLRARINRALAPTFG